MLKRQAENDRQTYRCVLCDSSLIPHPRPGLKCARCHAFYPEINGIKILLLNPQGLLRSQLAQVDEASSELKSRELWLSRVQQEAKSTEALRRLGKDHAVRERTQALLNEISAPISRYLDRQQKAEGLPGNLTSYHSGWPFIQMQPYFYKDWHGTQEARLVAKLFSNAINDYCDPGEDTSVVVLGCGACGLLYHVSQYFSHAYGVDLSLLTLLLSQKLLEGEQVDLSYSLPDESFPRVQRQVTIHGASERRDWISLLSGNITNLPFVTSSVSCVITQYMMNLVTDQRLLAQEINRILTLGGVWINFSTPGSITAFDLDTHLDLGSYARETGFELLESSMQRCRYLDFSEVSDWRLTIEHSNMFFALRKSHPIVSAKQDCFVRYFLGHPRDLLAKLPRLTNRFSVSVSSTTRFELGGAKQFKTVAIDTWGRGSLLKGAMPDEMAWFVQRLFELLERGTAVGDIVRILMTEFDGKATEREIVAFLRSLLDMSVIAFNSSEP